MKFIRSSGTASINPQGNSDNFTGAVFIDSVRQPDDQSSIGSALVRFAPGARTGWHRHPKGQTIYVTEGRGLVASRGSEVRDIYPGDVIYIEPGEEHWHGATTDYFMSHLVMQEADDSGQVVTWLEPVTDEDYNKRK